MTKEDIGGITWLRGPESSTEYLVLTINEVEVFVLGSGFSYEWLGENKWEYSTDGRKTWGRCQ